MSSDEFEMTCRGCLDSNGTTDLFLTIHADFLLCDLYSTLSQLELHEGDGLPKMLCSICTNLVIQFNAFRKQAQESETYLKNVMLKHMEEGDEFTAEPQSMDNDVKTENYDIIIENDDKTENNDIIEISEFHQEVITIKSDTDNLFGRVISKNVPQDLTYTLCGLKHSMEEGDEFTAEPQSTDNDMKTENNDIIIENDDIMMNDEVITIESDTENLCETSKNVPQDLICTFCGLKFHTYSAYYMHRKKEARIRIKTKQCSICQKHIESSKLKDHLNSHTKERPHECQTCGETYRFRSSLTRHEFLHAGKKPHLCHICGKSFFQASTLTGHMHTHYGEKLFMCNFCGKGFAKNLELDNHINKMHKIKDGGGITNSTDMKCKECNKEFSTKAGLNQHMQIHCERKFLCSECGKNFTRKNLLYSHLKTHSGVRPYPCHICGKSFAQSSSLDKHILVHTGEKPVMCILCGKRFSQQSHLIYHMRRHSGEKPYRCTYCNKMFSHSGTLKVHTRIHTGEKPFVCHICSKGFYDSSSMKKHIVKVHGLFQVDKIEIEIME